MSEIFGKFSVKASGGFSVAFDFLILLYGKLGVEFAIIATDSHLSSRLFAGFLSRRWTSAMTKASESVSNKFLWIFHSRCELGIAYDMIYFEQQN